MTMPTDDHMSKRGDGGARRIEVFTGAGRRREWSAEQKATIVAESYGGTSSVCDVARRHGLTPTQLFAWRRAAHRRVPPVRMKARSLSRRSSRGGNSARRCRPQFVEVHTTRRWRQVLLRQWPLLIPNPLERRQ